MNNLGVSLQKMFRESPMEYLALVQLLVNIKYRGYNKNARILYGFRSKEEENVRSFSIKF